MTKTKEDNLHHVQEARSFLGFAFDEICGIKTTACNIDSAKHYLNKVFEELEKFEAWQKQRIIEEQNPPEYPPETEMCECGYHPKDNRPCAL